MSLKDAITMFVEKSVCLFEPGNFAVYKQRYMYMTTTTAVLVT